MLNGGEVLDRVARGQSLVVTRDGAEVADDRAYAPIYTPGTALFHVPAAWLGGRLAVGEGLFTGMLGAALLVLLKELLSSTFGHWYLFLGIIFACVALLMPKGIVGSLLDLNGRRKVRAAASHVETPEGAA